MIIELAPDGPLVVDGDDLGGLSVRLATGATVVPCALVRPVDGDPGHVWLDVEELRRLAGAGRPDRWMDGFCRMVDYAAGHGWMDPDHRAVRAHIATPADRADGASPEAAGAAGQPGGSGDG